MKENKKQGKRKQRKKSKKPIIISVVVVLLVIIISWGLFIGKIYENIKKVDVSLVQPLWSKL